MGIDRGVTVVYSTEKPKIKLLPLQNENLENANDFALLKDFRVRIIPGIFNLFYSSTPKQCRNSPKY